MFALAAGPECLEFKILLISDEQENLTEPETSGLTYQRATLSKS